MAIPIGMHVHIPGEISCPVADCTWTGRVMHIEQEATIQKLRDCLLYWADELEEHRNDISNDEFEARINEMRKVAGEL